MNKRRKNKIRFFYQILSDMKNNIDTLIKELYENQNDLESFAYSKPVILKSKYPDLKKLGILTKNKNWEVTKLGEELLNAYQENDKEKYTKLVASILGSYNYMGFRPYAVLMKFFYMKYGIDKPLNREEIVKYFSLPIKEAMFYINTKKTPLFKNVLVTEIIEAPRPYSYTINHFKNAGLIIEKEKQFYLSDNTKDFLDIFFSDVENIPKFKTGKTNYKIISRGVDQVIFRQQLLEAYHNKCALTGKMFIFKNNNLLEAAHIIPVSHGGSYEVTNGILMTSNLHKAFDSGAIAFDDDYNILIDNDVYDKEYLPENKKINYLPDEKEKYPSLISIQYHREYIFGVGVLRHNN